MWWDIFILYGNREDASLDPLNRACNEVMAQSLALSNLAVKEGALHGLGHFSIYYPDECQKVIETFLDSERRKIPAELAAYAECAKVGGIS